VEDKWFDLVRLKAELGMRRAGGRLQASWITGSAAGGTRSKRIVRLRSLSMQQSETRSAVRNEQSSSMPVTSAGTCTQWNVLLTCDESNSSERTTGRGGALAQTIRDGTSGHLRGGQLSKHQQAQQQYGQEKTERPTNTGDRNTGRTREPQRHWSAAANAAGISFVVGVLTSESAGRGRTNDSCTEYSSQLLLGADMHANVAGKSGSWRLLCCLCLATDVHGVWMTDVQLRVCCVSCKVRCCVCV
jgi:hypothetical protein